MRYALWLMLFVVSVAVGDDAISIDISSGKEVSKTTEKWLQKMGQDTPVRTIPDVEQGELLSGFKPVLADKCPLLYIKTSIITKAPHGYSLVIVFVNLSNKPITDAWIGTYLYDDDMKLKQRILMDGSFPIKPMSSGLMTLRVPYNPDYSVGFEVLSVKYKDGSFYERNAKEWSPIHIVRLPGEDDVDDASKTIPFLVMKNGEAIPSVRLMLQQKKDAQIPGGDVEMPGGDDPPIPGGKDAQMPEGDAQIPKGKDAKMPTPSPEELSAAMKGVDDCFIELLSWAKTDDQKRSLASALLQVSDGMDAATNRYAVISKALTLFMDAKDLKGAYQTIDLLTKSFPEDGASLKCNVLKKWLGEELQESVLLLAAKTDTKDPNHEISSKRAATSWYGIAKKLNSPASDYAWEKAATYYKDALDGESGAGKARVKTKIAECERKVHQDDSTATKEVTEIENGCPLLFCLAKIDVKQDGKYVADIAVKNVSKKKLAAVEVGIWLYEIDHGVYEHLEMPQVQKCNLNPMQFGRIELSGNLGSDNINIRRIAVETRNALFADGTKYTTENLQDSRRVKSLTFLPYGKKDRCETHLFRYLGDEQYRDIPFADDTVCFLAKQLACGYGFLLGRNDSQATVSETEQDVNIE